MRKLKISFGVLSFSVIVLTASCTKETIVKETTIQKDTTVIIKQDVTKLILKKWKFLSHEFEQYSGSTLTNKYTENFSALGYYLEFKSGGTYTANDSGGTYTGTWQLLSDNHYVLDKGTSDERYYYIYSISDTRFINRGPYNFNNQMYRSYLFTGYFSNP